MNPAIKRLLIAGLICTIGAPLLGGLFTVIGMVHAFHTLGSTGISNPTALSNAIGEALIATWAGIMVGAFGAVLALIATIIHFKSKSEPPPFPG